MCFYFHNQQTHTMDDPLSILLIEMQPLMKLFALSINLCVVLTMNGMGFFFGLKQTWH